MLVKHLIRELEKMPPDLPVYTEGCDCWGDTYAIKREGGDVLIQRSENKGVSYKNENDTPVRTSGL